MVTKGLACRGVPVRFVLLALPALNVCLLLKTPCFC